MLSSGYCLVSRWCCLVFLSRWTWWSDLFSRFQSHPHTGLTLRWFSFEELLRFDHTVEWFLFASIRTDASGKFEGEIKSIITGKRFLGLLRMRSCLCCLSMPAVFLSKGCFIDSGLFDLVDLDDPYGALAKRRSTDIGEGRRTPTASSGTLISLRSEIAWGLTLLWLVPSRLPSGAFFLCE